jgi:phage baseplate assembly protein V
VNILSKIKNMFTMCKTTFYQDGKWKVSLLDGETLSQVNHAQNFGFKGRPPVGSRGLLLSRSGDKSAGVLIIIENDDQAPALADGEAAVYNNHGASILLKASGDIEMSGGDVIAKTGDVIAKAGDVVIDSGSVKIAGIQVVTSQQATIIDPTGGSIVDVQARAAIVLINAALKTHGLIAS